MPATNDQFLRELDEMCDDMEDFVLESFRDGALRVFSAIVGRTPVRTGFLRSRNFVDTAPHEESLGAVAADFNKDEGAFVHPPPPAPKLPLSIEYYIGNDAVYAGSIEKKYAFLSSEVIQFEYYVENAAGKFTREL